MTGGLLSLKFTLAGRGIGGVKIGKVFWMDLSGSLVLWVELSVGVAGCWLWWGCGVLFAVAVRVAGCGGGAYGVDFLALRRLGAWIERFADELARLRGWGLVRDGAVVVEVCGAVDAVCRRRTVLVEKGVGLLAGVASSGNFKKKEVMGGRLLSESFVRSVLLGRGRPRVWRHGLFWTLYGIYFYLQGISPDCVKGLDRADVLYYAFTSAVCFLPGCGVCVYACLYLLAPHLLLKKNYWGLVGGGMLLFALTAGANYPFGLLFFQLSCHCDVHSIPAMRVFAIGFLNSQNAMIAGGVALGAKLAAGEYYQRRENLRLARLQTRNRLGALKAKAQPDYLLCQLGSIATHIRAGATDPPAMILQLSGLLRYWLYDGMEDTIPLEEECTILQHFLRLEGARRCLPRVGELWIEGEIRRVRLAPMILLPLLQAASNRCREDRHGGPLNFLQLRIVLQGSRLSFRLDRAYSASGSGLDRPYAASRDGLFEDSEAVQSVIERLELCYPGRHELDIREVEETTSSESNRRLLHLALDVDVSFAGVHRRVSHPFTNREAYEPG